MRDGGGDGPLYVTSVWGKELAKKFKAEDIEVQHHIAHIFSQIPIEKSELNSDYYGIALDGTGYGLDGKIWGGEIFELKTRNCKLETERIGHLEIQIMIGGELAIQEPARILISILSKFMPKNEIHAIIKASSSSHDREQMTSSDRIYSKSEFEVLYNQLQQNFNCLETSSTGRILDAVSVLLGFAKNERKSKHEATYLLEKNSTKPYDDLRPKLQITNDKFQTNSKSKIKKTKHYILLTTPLFEYLIKNLHKDKKRLAATAQLYIAGGLHKIIYLETKNYKLKTILSGGISNNKIISNYFESKKLLQNKKSCTARGDAGLSVGQINYILSNSYICINS